ncbi:MAG TPA: BTAD domain-containing putative transcriptional regulator [Acidimicrobiales bacterium]|nr:BTAD domain-containing putative transcriptional regulator [Acidimicrobiales bacterium]
MNVNFPVPVTPTLSVKLVPPAIGPSYLARPRLQALLSDAIRRRLTVVVAGPGFGKSTLLASWAAVSNAAWYSLGPEDAQMPALARGVIDALRLRVPLVPRELTAVTVPGGSQGATDDDSVSRAHAFAQFLAQALEENLARELFLVLDDLHDVGTSPAAGQFITSLCRQAPANFHLVVSSRVEPPFAIERLRGRGQVLELSGSDLSFTKGEVAEVVTMVTGEADPGVAARLYQLTEGWPAAVRLAAEALRAVEPAERDGVLDRARQPGGSVYRYLAAEVLAAEPEEVRRLIAVVAQAGFASARFCEQLGVPKAAEILRSLARRGIFVEGRGQRLGWFSLSTLMRGTALAELPMERAESTRIDGAAAAWLEQEGHLVEALRHCRARADWAAVAQMLVRRGAELVSAGEATEVLAAVEALAPASRGPAIEFVAGEAYYVVGNWDAALRSYRAAAGGASALPTALAWRVARIHHFRGDLDLALECYGSGDPTSGDERDQAMLLAWRAAARWLRGDADGCKHDAVRAQAAASAANDPGALSCAYTALAMHAALEGDRLANDAYYLRALDCAVQAGDVLQQARVRANRGSLHLEQGYYEEAIAELDMALRLADLAGFASYRALALSNRGCAYYFLGRLEEAVNDLDEARRQSERLGAFDVAYSLSHLGRIYSDRGNIALARAAYEEAIARCEGPGDLQGLVPSLSGLALTLATDDPEVAERLAARAVGYGPGMAYVEALLAAGWVALANGRAGEAVQRASEAAAEARGRRDRAGLAWSLELRAAASPSAPAATEAIEQAVALWSELRSATGAARAGFLAGLIRKDRARADEASAVLRRLGVRSHISLEHLLERIELGSGSMTEQVPRLSVQTLGRFRVLVDGEPVPASSWQSRKARDLLKILLARRGRPVPRDEIMDMLWPEEARDKVANRLSVALSTLRAVLDPAKRASSNEFVVSDRESCRLDLEQVEVDIERFFAAAAEGLRLIRNNDANAVELLRQAESTYRGDFLEENVYDDWALAVRDEARSAYVRTCRALAEEAESGGNAADAGRYVRRLLERDAYDEAAHLQLVRVLLAGGQHGEAHRAYRSYSSRMAEMGVEAAPFPDLASPRS